MADHIEPTMDWLVRMPCTDDEMLIWQPQSRPGDVVVWEIPVLWILAEEYSAFDAKVISSKWDPEWQQFTIIFKGYCPFHKRHHSHQNWLLSNRASQDVTRFFCFHGNVCRWICHKMPFP